MTVPFCDASRAEVVARVAYQLVRLEYIKHKSELDRAVQAIDLPYKHELVKRSLDFRLALTSMYLACGTNGQTSKSWLAGVITRSRGGLLFRAVFYPEYKAGRRDPRVTNRGVGKQAFAMPSADDYEAGTTSAEVYYGD